MVDGPATAITLAAADVELDRSTRTTFRADLALLQHGGDLLDAGTAGRVVQSLLKTLLDPSAFVIRTGASALVRLLLIDTLAGVVSAAPPVVRDEVMEHLVDMPAEPDQAHATSWARVAEAMPEDAWTGEAIRRLAARNGDHWALRTVLRGLIACYDPAVQAEFLAEAEAGSLDALTELRNPTGLSGAAGLRLVDRLAHQVNHQIDDAHTGCYDHGGLDCGRTLAWPNVWRPDQADWDPLMRLLSDPTVAVEHKQGAVGMLAAHVVHTGDRPR